MQRIKPSAKSSKLPMKRRIQTHEQCLIEFTKELKAEVKLSLAAWAKIKPELAEARRAAYSNVFHTLKRKATEHGIPLSDLGLVDYEVPKATADA